MADRHQKRNKIGLRIAAVLMSLLLWFYVVNQGSLVSGGNSIDVPLQYHNVSADLNVTGPDKVAVRLWGSYKGEQEIYAYVDLAGFQKGEYQVPVKLHTVRGALFTSVQPTRVSITLEDIGERVLAIKHEVKLNPPVGLQLSQVMLSPDNCIVKGDAETIARVTTVVAPLDLASVKDIGDIKANLQARDANGKTITQGIQIVPNSINVYVVVEKKQLSKKVNLKPQITGKIADGYSLGEIRSEPEQVTVLGEQTVVEALNEINTKPIDITGQQADFSKLVELSPPAGTVVLPSQVTVHIKISKTGGTT